MVSLPTCDFIENQSYSVQIHSIIVLCYAGVVVISYILASINIIVWVRFPPLIIFFIFKNVYYNCIFDVLIDNIAYPVAIFVVLFFKYFYMMLTHFVRSYHVTTVYVKRRFDLLAVLSEWAFFHIGIHRNTFYYMVKNVYLLKIVILTTLLSRKITDNLQNTNKLDNIYFKNKDLDSDNEKRWMIMVFISNSSVQIFHKKLFMVCMPKQIFCSLTSKAFISMYNISYMVFYSIINRARVSGPNKLLKNLASLSRGAGDHG